MCRRRLIQLISVGSDEIFDLNFTVKTNSHGPIYIPCRDPMTGDCKRYSNISER